ncbi:MAG: hypothetical protein IPI10_02465 [Bacteroidetes bacterium]|nr:hypothetical protein [Bacteroidota bacterium]
MEGAFKGKMIRVIISFILLSFFIYSASGNDGAKLCKAVSKGKFNKVERIVKRHVNGLPESKESDSGNPANLSMDQNIDSLKSGLKVWIVLMMLLMINARIRLQFIRDGRL